MADDLANVPHPDVSLWAEFSEDPRKYPQLRAKDSDRDIALEVINSAYEDGRLTKEERDERDDQILQSKTLGSLVPLLNDISLTVPSAGQSVTKPRANRHRIIDDPQIRKWLFVALVCNVIWLLTWFVGGHGMPSYWPAYPMAGMGLYVLYGYFSTTRPPGSDRPEIDS